MADTSQLLDQKKLLKKTETIERHVVDIVSTIRSFSPLSSKHAVLIIARFMMPFENWIAPSSIKVLLTTDNAKAVLSTGALKKYTHVEFFPHFECNGEVEWRALQLNDKFHFTHVVALAEEDLIRAAKLRRLFGLSNGQTIDSALRFRDKVLMKESILAAHSFCTPKALRTCECLNETKITTQTAKETGKQNDCETFSSSCFSSCSCSSSSSCSSLSSCSVSSSVSFSSSSSSSSSSSLSASSSSQLQKEHCCICNRCFSRDPLLVPSFSAVESVCDIYHFIQDHGYPVVLKPRRGHFSIGTLIIHNEKELLDKCLPFLSDFHLSRNNTASVDTRLDMIVECFMSGTMYHIDGIQLNGKLELIWPSQYVNTVSSFSENRFIAGASLPRHHALTHRLRWFVRNCLRALQADGSFSFHAEVWHTPNDKLVLCEVASRTGGGEIKNEIAELFHINLNCSFVQAQCEDFSSDSPFFNSSSSAPSSNSIVSPSTSASSSSSSSSSLSSVPFNISCEPWIHRFPLVNYSICWLFIYPKIGILSSVPSEKELLASLCSSNNSLSSSSNSSSISLPILADKNFILFSTMYGAINSTFSSTRDCADALVSYLIRGSDPTSKSSSSSSSCSKKETRELSPNEMMHEVEELVAIVVKKFDDLTVWKTATSGTKQTL